MSGVPAFKLVEAGFSKPQVEALAEFRQTEGARRSDLLEVEHRLETQIGEVEHRLETKIGEVRSDLTELKGEFRLLKWMNGFVLAFLVAIFAKIFLH